MSDDMSQGPQYGASPRRSASFSEFSALPTAAVVTAKWSSTGQSLDQNWTTAGLRTPSRGMNSPKPREDWIRQKKWHSQAWPFLSNLLHSWPTPTIWSFCWTARLSTSWWYPGFWMTAEGATPKFSKTHFIGRWWHNSAVCNSGEQPELGSEPTTGKSEVGRGATLLFT